MVAFIYRIVDRFTVQCVCPYVTGVPQVACFVTAVRNNEFVTAEIVLGQFGDRLVEQIFGRGFGSGGFGSGIVGIYILNSPARW